MIATLNEPRGNGVANSAEESHPAFTVTSREYADEIYRDVAQDENSRAS
jgi:hypothetical protein